MEGRTIGQYRVTDVLGEGGMGVVYAAEHTLLGRPAAVKLLLPELSSKQEVVQRFFNEARAATAIRHPGIVEIYDFGWTNEGAGFIVMELLQGETLRARCKQGRMAWQAALAMTRQIAGALGAAHAKGIVHRDLKPDNVFLVPDPEVPGGERIKLLDFGIAKLADSSPSHTKTRTGAVLGTPTYMAPEQCRGVEVDSRADLYALGCILFELCSGRPPFRGEGVGDVLAAHIHVPPPTLGAFVGGIPQEVEALVQRLLAKAPLDRVQTAEEVIRLIDATGATAHDPRAITASPVPQNTVTSSVSRIPLGETIGHADTTLSSAITSRGRPIPRAPWRRLAVAGIASSAIAIIAASVLAIGGSDDEPSLRTSSLHDPVAAASTGTEPASPPPPPPGPATVAPERAPPAPPPTPPALPSQPAENAPPTVEIEITSSPSGAEIVSGGKVMGVTPFHSVLPRADLDIRFALRLRGHATKLITVYAGAPSKQHVQLAAMSPPAPSSPGSPAQPHGINPFKKD